MFVQCKFVRLAKLTVTRENLTLQQFSNLISTDWFSDKKRSSCDTFLRCLPTWLKERSLQQEEKKKRSCFAGGDEGIQALLVIARSSFSSLSVLSGEAAILGDPCVWYEIGSYARHFALGFLCAFDLK